MAEGDSASESSGLQCRTPTSPCESQQALLEGVPPPSDAPKRDNKSQDFEKWFDWIPLKYRVGPWSPVAYMFLVAWPIGLAFFGPRMLQSYHSDVQMVTVVPGSQWFWIAVAGALWTIILNVHMVRKWSVYPYASFTLLSWSLLTLRFLCIVLSPCSNLLLALGEVLRFPTLASATVTTVVWNVFLQPVIYFSMPTPKQRSQFVKFNCQFALINIHVLNLPLALLSHYCSLRTLVFFDVWVSSTWVFLYALFYLLVLDARGIHMYPVFTPRTHFCFVSYSLLIGLHLAVFQLWATLLA